MLLWDFALEQSPQAGFWFSLLFVVSEAQVGTTALSRCDSNSKKTTPTICTPASSAWNPEDSRQLTAPITHTHVELTSPTDMEQGLRIVRGAQLCAHPILGLVQYPQGKKEHERGL